MPKTEPETLLTPMAVAVRLGCSIAWVYQLTNRGQLPYVESDGSGRRIPERAVAALQAEKAAEPDRDEAARKAARHMVDRAIADGVLPAKPRPETLARIARAMKAIEVP